MSEKPSYKDLVKDNQHLTAEFDRLTAKIEEHEGHIDKLWKACDMYEAAFANSDIDNPPEGLVRELVEALQQALRQWQMYAGMTEDREIATEQSTEGALYRHCAALAKTGRKR